MVPRYVLALLLLALAAMGQTVWWQRQERMQEAAAAALGVEVPATATTIPAVFPPVASSTQGLPPRKEAEGEDKDAEARKAASTRVPSTHTISSEHRQKTREEERQARSATQRVKRSSHQPERQLQPWKMRGLLHRDPREWIDAQQEKERFSRPVRIIRPIPATLAESGQQEGALKQKVSSKVSSKERERKEHSADYPNDRQVSAKKTVSKVEHREEKTVVGDSRARSTAREAKHRARTPLSPARVVGESRERETHTKEQRREIEHAAQRVRQVAESLQRSERRMLASLGTTSPRLRHEVRRTLIAVARGELDTEEAARRIAQRLAEAGKGRSKGQDRDTPQAVAKQLLSRKVVQSVKEAAREMEQVRRLVVQSPAEEVLADSDGDGLSDFEERVLWGTDPHNPFTAGDTLSDAERVLLGLDPLGTSTTPVPVASPKEEGETLPHLLAVTRVAALSEPIEGKGQASSSSSSTSTLSTSRANTTLSSQSSVATTTVGLVLEGRSIPNTTAWLYIFSTPIVVAVRADETGVWRYTLRRELPDGEHEVYVAIVNAAGAIVAKSPPARFIKQAQAVTYLPPARVAASQPREPALSFLDLLRASVWGVALIAAGIAGLLALVVIGLWRLRADRGEQPR